MVKHTPDQREWVRIIRDACDATWDYRVPRAHAEAMYNAGKITRDLTNGCYATLDAHVLTHMGEYRHG